MRVFNQVDTYGLVNVYNGDKTQKGYKYLVICRDMPNFEGSRALYVVQQKGERSWVGSLIDGDSGMTPEITGNSGTILSSVIGNSSANDTVLRLRASDKPLYRKCVMEYMAYGNIGVTIFNVEKEV